MQDTNSTMDDIKPQYTPKIGKCGFRNIGNTCYMNSILQLLVHCNSLIAFFAKITDKAEYEEYLTSSTIDNISSQERKRYNIDPDQIVHIRQEQINFCKENSVSKQLASIIDQIINRGASLIGPISLKRTIDKKISSFRGFSQQDAHEFLIFMLDTITEETGIKADAKINNVTKEIVVIINKYMELEKNVQKASTNIEDKQKAIKEKMEFRSLNRDPLVKYEGLVYQSKLFGKKYNPFVYQLQTILISETQCNKCKNIVTSYENTSVLQLYIKDSLIEMFENFVKVETINNYACSICNEKTDVLKQTRIWRSPSVLFIHLKRFEIIGNRMRKNDRNVSIPFELNLEPYCDMSMQTDKKISKNYKLKGCSNHSGNLNGGHYTADCLCIMDKKTWYNFDDTTVNKYVSNTLDLSNAYILMYELE